MKKVITAITLPLLLAACQSTGNETATAKMITPQHLQHHNWQLIKIDNEAIKTPANKQAPNLEIGENMMANGNAGCNNFFGQGELDGNKFRIQQMGMTMKLCMDDVMGTETAMSKALTDWSEMTLTKETLTLTNDNHTLTFKLSEWM